MTLCAADFSFLGWDHGFMKADGAFSVKVYHRNQNLTRQEQRLSRCHLQLKPALSITLSLPMNLGGVRPGTGALQFRGSKREIPFGRILTLHNSADLYLSINKSATPKIVSAMTKMMPGQWNS
jgi:hypothetical protein